MGDKAYELLDFYGARHYYRQALDMDSTKAELQYKFAETLRHINDYKGAERMYHKVYRKDRGRFYPQGIYWVAKMNEYLGDYNKAIKFWKKQKGDDEAKALAKHRIAYCEYAKAHQAQDSVITITNAGKKINSAESEFGVLAQGDSVLYYSSLRGDYNDNDELLEDTYGIGLYKSTYNKKHKRFNRGVKIEELSDDATRSLANGALNQRGDLFFYTVCDSMRVCQIYVADFDGERFSNPRPLDSKVNIPNSSTTQPHLATINRQEYLFFSSDRPGGQGQHDIWYCEINGTQTETAVNAGSKINSSEREITPFIDVDNMTLYFSSDYHLGYGGFDIFSSAISRDLNFAQPKNMGLPTNSSVNDLYYYKKDEYKAYLTSNRIGSIGAQGETCCNDIWVVDWPNDNEQENDTTSISTTEIAAQINSLAQDSILPEIGEFSDLSKYLPITLYFDNDHPNPRSSSNTTTLSYNETYVDYKKQHSNYASKLQQLPESERQEYVTDINQFFNSELDYGYGHLDLFCRLLLRELESGAQVELAVKGYASPLANSNYNDILTSRRIKSLVNELSRWQNGALLPYLNHERASTLRIKPIPYGETKASSKVSDSSSNRMKSVYSANAARERRIEILEIKEVD